MAHRSPMTITGAEQLKKELEHLEQIVRPTIIQAIAEARAHGDLKENAEYHAAKESQGFTEARIRYIKEKLATLQIVNVTKIVNTGRVIFGSTVTIVNIQTNEEQTYQIVGEDEADIKAKKISFISPVGQALIGKSINNEIEVNTPSGTIAFKILAVNYI